MIATAQPDVLAVDEPAEVLGFVDHVEALAEMQQRIARYPSRIVDVVVTL
jgi:hypothetical protein